jgi:HemY protein
MRTLFWLIALFAVAAGLAHLAHLNTGYAVFVFPPYRAHVSMNFLAIALLTGFGVLYLGLRLLSRLRALPRTVGAYAARRRHDRGEQALHNAVLAYLSGQNREALRHAEKAFKNGQAPATSALLAALSAQSPRDSKKQSLWLAQAQAHENDLGVALPLAKADLALRAGDPDHAQSHLESILEAEPKNIRALDLAMKVALARQDFPQIIRLAQQTEGPWHPHEARALCEDALHNALEKAAQTSPQALLSFWQELPSNQQHDHRVLQQALPLLAQSQKADAARRVLEKELDKHWNDTLARYYWHTCLEDLGRGMARAEKWLVQHPKEPGLLFSLGELCFHAGVFGKAESYLEASFRIQPRQETHLALARLFDKTERPEKAGEQYRLAATFTQPRPVSLVPVAITA